MKKNLFVVVNETLMDNHQVNGVAVSDAHLVLFVFALMDSGKSSGGARRSGRSRWILLLVDA